jgi:hypothetical protein
MTTRVFSQHPDLVAALPQLLGHARRFFAAEVEVLSASAPGGDGARAETTVRLSSARYPGHGTFRIDARPTSDADRSEALAAEQRGRAGGMAALAARCPIVWEVTPEGDPSGAAELQVTALLASVALGPVLPDDGSTLYGVRGAMERAERFATKSTESGV